MMHKLSLSQFERPWKSHVQKSTKYAKGIRKLVLLYLVTLCQHIKVQNRQFNNFSTAESDHKNSNQIK